MTTLRLGTRRSRLALTQSGQVADALRASGLDVEIVEIVTEGDTNRASLESIGGTGVFASALRQALRTGAIDVAVHSLKDLPTTPEPGLTVAATPAREDVRDVLVARDSLTLGELPPGARVGTGSPRREAQLVALGLGLEIVAIRGNVETRLAMVESGELDAVVLARAGLLRLGLADRATEVLDPIQILPAAGQGALAVECRAADAGVRDAVAILDDPDTRACVDAERTVLAVLEAGCTAPVGVLAEVVEGLDALELSVRAFVGTRDGRLQLRRSVTGPADDPTSVGTRLAALLLDDGAAEARGERDFKVAPGSPTAPMAPASPTASAGPVASGSPTVPTAPMAPASPTASAGPVAPGSPTVPAAPMAPALPTASAGPVASGPPTVPAGPVAPGLLPGSFRSAPPRQAGPPGRPTPPGAPGGTQPTANGGPPTRPGRHAHTPSFDASEMTT